MIIDNGTLVQSLLQETWNVPYLTFFVAAIGSLAGAWGGAYAADKIARKKEIYREENSEFKATLNALAMVNNIINTIAQLKMQHLDGLVSSYEQLDLKFQQLVATHKQGEVYEIYVPMDFQTLPKLVTPVVDLQRLVYERISLSGRQVMLMAQLVQCLHALDQAIDGRTIFIKSFKSKQWETDKEKIECFFGLPTQEGNIDADYKSLIEALKMHSDGCLAFSRLLHDALLRKAKKLKKHLAADDVKIYSIDFLDVEKKITYPDMADYARWVDKPGEEDASVTLKGRLQATIARFERGSRGD